MPSKNPKRQTKPRRRRRGMNPLYVLIPVALVMLTGGVWLLMTPSASSGTSEPPRFPAWLQVMDPQVRQAYAQAVAHREELQYIPCYCGCGGMGHAAVVDCHIASATADGSITFERHASACEICLDLALDASTWLEEGVSLGEVRSMIEAKYSQFGPSTDAPPVPTG